MNASSTTAQVASKNVLRLQIPGRRAQPEGGACYLLLLQRIEEQQISKQELLNHEQKQRYESRTGDTLLGPGTLSNLVSSSIKPSSPLPPGHTRSDH